MLGALPTGCTHTHCVPTPLVQATHTHRNKQLKLITTRRVVHRIAEETLQGDDRAKYLALLAALEEKGVKCVPAAAELAGGAWALSEGAEAAGAAAAALGLA